MGCQLQYGLMVIRKKTSTRDEAHSRRAGAKASTNITISEDRVIPCTKKTFFANKNNNQTFIDALSAFLTQRGIRCSHGAGYTDLLD